MADWYVSSVGYAAVAVRVNTTAYIVGDIRRPAAPTLGNERCWRCTVAGTSAGAEPATFGNGTVAQGGTVVDGGATWTEISGNATFNWTAPYATIGTAVATGRSAAGDRIFVAHNHALSTATSFTITPVGTVASPTLVYCVNAAGTVPPVAADLRTTAIETTTGIASMTFSFGVMYIYGVTFSNSGASNNINFDPGGSSRNLIMTFEQCALKTTDTAVARRLNFGSGAGGAPQPDCALKITLIDTTLAFGASAQQATFKAVDFTWRNNGTGAAFSGVLPTIPFQIGGSTFDGPSFIRMEGLDLSAFTAGKTLFDTNHTNTRAMLLNCKLDAAVAIAVTPTAPGGAVDVICSDSTSSTDRSERFAYQGTQTRESTIIRPLGANNSVVGMSWKIVTNANNEKEFPFECQEIITFNPTSGVAITATVEIVNDGVTLKDDEVWMEVEYLGTAGFPIVSRVSCGRATPLTAGANIPTSAATWTTTGLGAPVLQKLVVTFTPQIKGMVRARVYVGKISQTLYVDPKITLV